jgi:hypothetical protein
MSGSRYIAGVAVALALLAPVALPIAARADCGPAAKEALGDASTGPTVPDTPSSGVASDRQQMAGRQATPQPGNPQMTGRSRDALGDALNPGTGTTAPGVPSHGAASDRRQTANAGRGAAQDGDCK